MASARRRKIGHRRRVEDEGDDDGGPEGLELDDDSMSDGSSGTDDGDASEDSDTSNIDEMSPTGPDARKTTNGVPKTTTRTSAVKNNAQPEKKAVTDTEMMLNGLTIADDSAPAEDLHFDEVSTAAPKSPSAPVVVSSASAARPPAESSENRRRQEHDNYRRKRDEDPAFVPNRGSFFMHDHRHAGPAANGFRPFGRGRGRGGFGGGVGGPFSPMNSMYRPNDPTTNSQWTHDMHETVVEPTRPRHRHMNSSEGPANGNGFIPTCQPNPTPINRTLSTEKHIGNAQIRVLLPEMKAPVVKPGVAVKQYTKLPDHRPPLRRDKPVRISLPQRPPRYIYPAVDRSFVFIPRAMRPNQQRTRGGKPRSGYGSVGGFSRRTSVFGGSYYGSMYSPSIAMSRRSSIGYDRESTFSPAGSVMSRSALPVDNPRPVVRLPPAPRPDVLATGLVDVSGPPALQVPVVPNMVPPPQPPMQENRPADIPIHQPRPKKNISVADIESPALAQGPQAFQQPFHQQMPVQVSNGYQKETHSRQPSHLSHPSVGTPLSQIPERAIHAAPFQPNVYGQPQYYNHQPYQGQAQQPYYYPQGYSTSSMPGQAPVPQYLGTGQQPPPSGFPPQNQPGQMPGHPVGPEPVPPANNLVAQEANGMVYYYDASQIPQISQIPQMNTYQPYSTPQSYQPGVMGMGGMVTPSPDGYYYPQPAPGMVYYSQ
ncbi:hypothetical protein V2G26_003424 [Clonostachys chloroleuca]